MQEIKSKQIIDGILSIVKKDNIYYLFLKWYEGGESDEPEILDSSSDLEKINLKYKQAK